MKTKLDLEIIQYQKHLDDKISPETRENLVKVIKLLRFKKGRGKYAKK